MKQLRHKKTRGMIKVLSALSYRDIPIYIRMIGGQLFMYDLIYKNQIYSSYLIINPKKGSNKLTESEIQSSRHLINASAEATVDMLLGVQLSDEEKRKAEMVLSIN